MNGEPILTTEKLTKSYKLTDANKEITVSLPKGGIIGFVGENGSGKTTFLRMICGLTFPSSGSFSFGEKGCRIGAIVESPAFHPSMSARDNLRFQARLCGSDGSNIDRILDMTGLSDTGAKKARHFSLGMKQRLGIAIALLSEPELLILDEPTNGLDPEGIIELRGLLKHLCAETGMTILISSHILSELSLLAEYYLFIHKGRLIRAMPACELNGEDSKLLMFKCCEDAGEFMRTAAERGLAAKTEVSDGWNVIRDPKNYPALLEALSKLGVTELETKDETLESHYISLMNGGGAK